MKLKKHQLLIALASLTLSWQSILAKETQSAQDLYPQMVLIKSGEFEFGCSPKSDTCNSFQVTPVQITVPAYYLATTEVTFEQWQHCVDANVCEKPRVKTIENSLLPVSHVSWKAIQVYIQWLSEATGKDFRLPSDVEWEYAYEAGNTKRLENVELAPVGSNEPNDFGIYDLNSNVFEYTADCWRGNYNPENITSTAFDRPDCRRRVRRGDSWKKKLKGDRFGAAYDYYFEHGGFRLALDATETDKN